MLFQLSTTEDSTIEQMLIFISLYSISFNYLIRSVKVDVSEISIIKSDPFNSGR